MEPPHAATLDLIRDARTRIEPYAKVTPVHTCSTIDHLVAFDAGGPVEVSFKCETFQKGGAFKYRGAMNAVLQLTEDQRARGVVTHSSGNHAGALALAARTIGIPAHLVVPEGAPACKLDAIHEYGGIMTRCKATVPDREATAGRIQRETGATLIPPYDHSHVICGQGTIGLEFMEQVPGLDVVLVPVSGGGMIAGVAAAVKGINENCAVVAAEPCGASTTPRADVAASKARGRLVSDMPPPDTIADGLRAKLGALTWPIVRDKVDGVVTVTEPEIVRAMALIYERMKLVVEPSGAVGLAAALSEQFKGFLRARESPEATVRVGVVLCGGNVDLAPLWATYKV